MFVCVLPVTVNADRSSRLSSYVYMFVVIFIPVLRIVVAIFLLSRVIIIFGGVDVVNAIIIKYINSFIRVIGILQFT